MIANYHTHTYRCGHAVGEDRQYVETAIERGLKVLGFSDHVPMPFPDGHESRFRVPLGQLEDYVTSVLDLRAEYKRDIDVRLGFEAEYYPDLFEAMLELLRPYPVDYMILAQHFNDSRETIYNPHLQLSREALQQYVDMVVAGMETGKYSCVAHPDLFYFAGPDRVYQREMARICRRAKELDVPLEINVLGLREGRCYPNDLFWPLVKAEGCRAVLGCAAHRPEDGADPGQLKAAMAFADRFGVVPEAQISLRKPF
jgi:histidinol-phosphatase (PHP family)